MNYPHSNREDFLSLQGTTIELWHKVQPFIDGILRHNSHNKRNADAIAYALDITPRDIRRITVYLRSIYYPVCSDNNGYWLADNTDDIKITMKRLLLTIKSLTKTYKSLKHMIKNWDQYEIRYK